ncbi:hypothetical protein [Ramlibacter sp. PS4R-6]|uniref:hypothetical protein n=1 Tax=Ramlibacter sp. PS4R-6 TaxID=3133438 RepID=UPI0030AB3B24
MLYRPATPPFPRDRMSPSALATTTAIHAGILWLLLQYSPLVPTVRYVVYQYVRPLSPSANASRAITLPQRNATPSSDMAIFSNVPESSVPMKATRQLPETLQAREPAPLPPQPEPEPVREAAKPQPSVPAPPDVAPAVPVPVPPLPLPQPPPAPAPVPPEIPAPAPAPVPIPQPVVPEPAPAPAPVPVPAPALPAPPAPAPTPPAPPAPEPVPAPPAPAPVPAPPAPIQAAPVPAPAVPAPSPRLQGPVVDVPVQPGTPGAGTATPIAIPAPPGWGGPATPVPAAPRPALPPPPVLTAPAIPSLPGPYRTPPQRSLSEMANQQLRRDRKDPLAQGVEAASRGDCLHAPKEGEANYGLLNAPILAMKALTDKCPK